MNTLPNVLHYLIFEFIFGPKQMKLFKGISLKLEDVYDIENKNVYQKLIEKEFISKTNFWRIKWLNKDLNFGSSSYEEERGFRFNEIKFNNLKESLNFIIQYWNNLKPLNNTHNCVEEYITDHFKKSKNVLKKLKQSKSLKLNDK